MRIKHTLAWLAALVAVLSPLPSVRAQTTYTPFGPIDYVEDGQAFETYDYHEYNDPLPAREGWFFSMERVAYFMNHPRRTEIGQNGLTATVLSGQGLRVADNSYDTSCLTTDDAWGNRYEFGFWEDQSGWMLSVFDGGNQDQLLVVDDMEVVFQDDPGNVVGVGGLGLLFGFVDRNLNGIDDDLDDDGVFGRFGPTGVFLPNDRWDFDDTGRYTVIFTQAQVRNLAYMDGVELMKTQQLMRTHHGGILELNYGVRYTRFRDRFRVRGVGGVLSTSEWHNLADNNIVGPQIAARWYTHNGRWNLSAEGRFMAGFNFQSMRLKGFLGSDLAPVDQVGLTGRGANLPAFFDPSSFSDSFSANEFAPTGELRLNAAYSLTTDIALKFGYTGLYTYGVSRASNTINYTLPHLSIKEDNTQQSLWTNMVTVGIEWNR